MTQDPNTDPVAAMLAQTSLDRTAFPPPSRYAGIAIAVIEQDGQPVSYLRRRFLPRPESLQTQQLVGVVEGDRGDILASRYLGDPTLFWRLCDANNVDRPEDLAATPGTILRVTLPAGLTGTTL
jgi:hypothetical protein